MTPAPKTPGTINLISLRTPAVRRGHGKASAMPARAHDTINQRNWARPASASSQATRNAASTGQHHDRASAAMRKILSSIGVAAVAAKRSTEVRMPPCSETSEMKSR